MKTVKVLKPGIIMGEVRKFGDELPKDEFFSLPVNVQSSLIGANHVEIVDDESSISDEGRFEAIEKRLAHLEGLIFQKPKSSIPSKGNEVKFTDDKGSEVTGIVTSIVKKDKMARIKTKDDQKFAVDFNDLTIIK
jgi:hypothetical protein